MKKTFTFVLMLVASLFMGNKLWADGEHTIELSDIPGSWRSVSEWYDASEIATELGTDASTLFKTIASWEKVNYANEFFTLQTDAAWSYTHGGAGDGAFYIDYNGTYQEGYGSAAAYCRFDYDEENNAIAITLGQTPSCGEGVVKCVCAINYKDQKVVFNVTLNVAYQTTEIDKDPVTTMADLNIVGRTTFPFMQSPISDWSDGETYSVPMAGICSALDIDPDYMSEKIGGMLYAKSFDSGTENWKPELTNEMLEEGVGFWFDSGVTFENEEAESMELTWGDYTWDTSSKFYIDTFTFSKDDEALSFLVGQNPGAWDKQEERTADLYIIYGDKAWILTLDMTVGVDASKTIENYTKLGSLDYTIQRNPRDGEDNLSKVELDMTKILAAFPEGTKAENLTLYGEDWNGIITKEYNTDGTGFWFDADGGVIDYEEGYKSYFVNLVDNTLEIGNMTDAFDGGEFCQDVLYLISGQNYYAIHVYVKMDKPEKIFDECEIVAEKNITIEQIPTTDGSWQTGTTDASFLKRIIGTNNGKIYGVASDGSITDSYSVSEASDYGGGGFWMSPKDENNNAYAAGYTSTGAFAIWYYQGEFNWFNYPGLPQVGESVYATFYVANLWDGKAVKLNVTLKWVDEIFTIETEGEEDIEVAQRSEDGSYAVTPVDLSACAEALGTTVEEFEANGDWFVVNSDNVSSQDGFVDNYGYMLNEDGCSVSDESQAKFTIGCFEDGFHSYVYDANNTYKYDTTIYATYDGKNYAFNVIVNPVTTGISSVAQTFASKSTTYDLSGRRITRPAHQVIIRDGKKMYVK